MFMLCVYVLKKKRKQPVVLLIDLSVSILTSNFQYLVFILGEDANLSSTYFAT